MSQRVLVVGVGSIGRRHSENLRDLGAAVDMADVDAAHTPEIEGCRVVDLAAASQLSYDGIVVASPTNMHVAHTTWALERAEFVLVEKPLAPDVASAAPLLPHLDRIMVGYNLRLVTGVERLVRLARDGDLGTLYSVRVWFGQSLPTWRPGTDYRTGYSAQRRLGGGVLLDAIHELDLLVWLLGTDGFGVVGATVDRLGDLDIDCEDHVAAVLRHTSGTVVTVELDYLSPAYRRGIEIVGSAQTARLDWSDRTLAKGGTGVWRSEPVDLDAGLAYKREAAAFLSMCGGGTPPVGGHEGLASVALATDIRKAADTVRAAKR